MSSKQTGVFVISIDFHLNKHSRTGTNEQTLSRAGNHLIELLARYQLPATWAIPDPARAPAARSIASTKMGHEIAVLGDSTWVGPQAGRTYFSRELIRRVITARKAGLPATTLSLNGTRVTNNADLLVKHGVNVVRPDSVSTITASKNGQPQTLRYGVWQVPPVAQFPLTTGWLPGGGAVPVRRAIRRAITGNQIAHLAIDAAKLAHTGDSVIKSLDWILRDVVSNRQSKAVTVKTLAQIANDAAAPRKQIASKSVLLRAA